MAGKYEPLRRHLAALASADQATAELSFAEIAKLVNGLPASAYERRQWWANNSHTQAQSWRAAGWQVQQVYFARQLVRFARGTTGGTHLARSGRTGSEPDEVPLVAGSQPVDLEVRVGVTWHVLAPVVLDTVGDLLFPDLPRAPGIYRLTLSRSGRRWPPPRLRGGRITCANAQVSTDGLARRSARACGSTRSSSTTSAVGNSHGRGRNIRDDHGREARRATCPWPARPHACSPSMPPWH